NQPVKSMQLIVNGRPYVSRFVAREGEAPAEPATADRKQETGDTREHSTDLWLPPGRHSVAVKAETDASVGLSDPIEITRGPAEGQPRPKLRVLAIGGGSDTAALATALATAAPKDVADVKPRILQGKDATPEAIVT